MDIDSLQSLWSPYMKLLPALENIFTHKTPNGTVLKRILRTAKPHFSNVFKNPPKNAKSREQIMKALTEGKPIKKFEMLALSKEVVEEVLILSDMYDLDELMALELLSTAQYQNPKYPELCRGLVAVLLYYNAHHMLVSSLRLLIEGSAGRTWIPRVNPECAQYIGQFVDQLMNDGLFSNILILLENKDLSKEVELLQKNKAIGGPKHHQLIVSLFTEICSMLAECVFYYSVQFGLSKQQLLSLLQYLQKIIPDVDSKGVVKIVPLFMVTSFFYAIDLNCIKNAQEISGDTKEQFLSLTHAQLTEHNWEWPELKSIASFALAVEFAKLRSSQHVFKNKSLFNIDETLINDAMGSKVFRFLNQNIAASESFYYVELMIKKFHQLVTEFIVLVPHVLKEIRNKSDEIAHAHQEGLELLASEENNFEQLLLAMATLYAKDPLKLNLNLDYWPRSCEQFNTIKMSSFLMSQKFQSSLYRFVCRTGDMLPHILFVPYVNMLSSLAKSEIGAENVFNFCLNATNSNLTWDHFFKTFVSYFTNLRQENICPSDTVYKKSHQKSITALEIQGLQAILKLIRNVAEYSAKSKLSFLNYLEWETLPALLGLVSCPIKISLKADLILTLATLVKPPPTTTASSFWQTLEASQMIVTIPTFSSCQSRGIMAELDYLETRNEEYPLTISLLKLLSTLAEQPIPNLLGSSTRTPGFDPYLNFVINNIFLKCLSRGYKNQNEKWEVSGLCLELALKLLNQYEPQLTDFLSNGVRLPDNTTINVNPPPGFHIMTYMCTNSDFLRTILNIIHLGCQMFDLYFSFSGKEEMAKTTLVVLRLIKQALHLQQKFLNASVSSGSTLIYTRLHKKLVSINEFTNEPDYIIDLSKFVMYSKLPEHTYHAIHILMTITSYPIPQSLMVSYFTSNPQLTIAVRHGFVQCLEESESSKFNELSTVQKCKESILKLLLQCLKSAPPNLAHYLLGFNLDNVQKTCFENAGVGRTFRNCLHSVIDILDDSLKSQKHGSVSNKHAKLLELCYQLIYVLISSNQTSRPVLVYLKSQNDFILRHAFALPFYTERSSKKVDSSNLIQMNWLLRIIAVEIKMHVHQNLSMTLKKLILLFIGNAKNKNNILESELLQPQFPINLVNHSTFEQDNDQDDGKRLLDLLDIVNLEFELTPDYIPKLKYLESKHINQLLNKCEVPGKVPFIDVKELRSTLMNEFKSIDCFSTVKTSVLQEIQDFLAHAVSINDKRLQVNCIINYVDAWHQLTAVIFSMANLPSFEFQQRFTFVNDLLVMLQSKVICYPQMSELSTLITNSQLFLLINLKNTIDNYLMLRITNPDLHLGSFLSEKSSVYSSMLQNTFKCIQQSGSQKLRASLYSSLIALINLLATNSRTLTNGHFKQQIKAIPSKNQQILDSESIKFIKSLNFDQFLNEQIFEVICVDLTSGHDICKVLSYSLCELFIDINPKLIGCISNQGYLKCIISSLLKSDLELKDSISTKSKTLKPIYVYESKMSLLNKIATYTTGADALLNHQVIACLSSMKAIDSHPSFEKSFKSSLKEFMPDEGERYMMICLPAMSICQTMITTLGNNNMTSILQVVYYLVNHRDAVTIALTNAVPLCEHLYLKELYQLTSLFISVTNEDVTSIINSSDDKEIAGFFQHCSALMQKILTRFSVNLSTIRAIREKFSDESCPNDGKTNIILYLRITLNLLNYVSNLMDGGRASGGQTFQKRILDVSMNSSDLFCSTSGDLNQDNQLSITTIVSTIIQTVEYYFMQFNTKTWSESRISTIQLFGESCTMTKIENEDVESDEPHRMICSQILEVCLYILWAHTNFYFTHSPVQNMNCSKRSKRSESLNQVDDDGVTHNELKELKQGLVKVFNEAFLEKLFAINKEKSEDSFMQVMVHRIKTLLQFANL